jgi:hypothetical protein
MGNNGTTYIPQMSIPTKTGQGASEQITAGDDGHVQAGFYRGPTRFLVTGNLVTDLYTMLQWVKDPSKIIVGADGLTLLGNANVRGDYDSTAAYAAMDQVTYNNGMTTYVAAVGLPAVLTDSNPGHFLWQFTVAPSAHCDAGNNLYWAASSYYLTFYSDAAHTNPINSPVNIGGSSWIALPAPFSGYMKITSGAYVGSGTLHVASPGSIIATAGNYIDPSTSGGFWSTFGTGLAATWSTCLSNCLGLTYGGMGGWSANNPLGWRAPMANEAMGIYDFSLASAPFGNANFVWPAGNMWTGTIVKSATTKAFALLTQTAVSTNGPFNATAQTSTNQQRPVRSLIYSG